MRFLLPLLTTLALFSLPGCGKSGYAELGLVDVSGAVTLDNKPLAGAKVAFEGDDKRSAIGTTDSSGKYALMYDSQTRGTTPGAKIVRITTAEVGEGGGAAEGAVVAKESLPARYNQKSELKADVSAANKTFNFDLKSAP
ncbi:MAG TPA: carboxypeptidase regulatory-like domain-containing protein [Pirellulaceae bacterium]|jgi:hypothetical protein